MNIEGVDRFAADAIVTINVTAGTRTYQIGEGRRARTSAIIRRVAARS
jgi:hypothetical protein